MECTELAMGIYDSPQTQKQPIFYLDYYRSNIAVFGGSMTGKTVFIKTLLVRIHEKEEFDSNRKRIRPDENIYIVDFGGNLGGYSCFNKVCACFDSSNEENIKRVFKTIERKLDENTKALKSNNYVNFANKNPNECPPHITLIIENTNAFLSDERYSSYQERLMKFCRDGLSKGLTVIMTANDVSGMSRLLDNCGQKIVFEMPADKYFEIFNMKINKPMKIPGRAVINKESDCYEFQCFLPFEYNEFESLVMKYDETDRENREEDKAVLSDMINTYVDWYLNRYCEGENIVTKKNDIIAYLTDRISQYVGRENENRLVSFPEELPIGKLEEYYKDKAAKSYDPNCLIVGFDYNEQKPVLVDINKNRALAIYGKREFGKTNLLYLLLTGIKEQKHKTKYIYVDDGRGELEYFYNISMKEFNEISNNSDGLDYIKPQYYRNLKEFQDVIDKITITSTGKEDFLTVFVLQSKAIYQNTKGLKDVMHAKIPEMISESENNNYLFIFSDVKAFADLDVGRRFNNQINIAFLLDNIGEFVADKGQKTVFAELDAKELKAEFAKCSIGDGYYFETEVMDEPQKVKFIKGPQIPKANR